ncbi:oxidized low-density lipoprotein receptor 1-like [Mobula hypostoma]|uniref:oxidized low-density lipoprotein receptor 1-like n=1 Tax=Mobula hypostoma TaxID=723540 RepID=UPI002FC2E227
MEDSQTYANVQLVKPDSRFPTRTEPDVSYAEPNIKCLSVPRTDEDRLTSTYSELNFGKDETLIDEDEDPPVASGPGELRVTARTDGVTSTYSMLNLRKDEILIDDYEDPPITSAPAEMPVTAQGGAHEQEPKENIGNRPHRKIYLLCLVTSSLVVIVAGLSIHVSQIRQSMITSDRNHRELTSHLNLSQRTCLKNLSALNSELIDLNRTHADLRHQFTEMQTKYRSVNETKAQICELLTSRREHTCSKDWITNKDRCYYVSTFETSFYTAMRECSNRDARLLEINSRDEASFVSHKLVHRNGAYWIGKCEDGNVDWDLLYKVSSGTSDCGDCRSYPGRNSCNRARRFICEKLAPLFPDIPENIQDLCQQPMEATGIK